MPPDPSGERWRRAPPVTTSPTQLFGFTRKKAANSRATKIEVRHRKSGEVLLTVESDSLEKLELDGVDLRGADLRGVNLYYSSLSNVNLRDADLRGANLFGVDLRASDLRGANLRGANLGKANLRFIRYDHRTRWPWFFNLQEAMRR